MRVAVVAEWYPSPADPVLGIWAHRQAVAARAAGADVRVIAMRRPIPPLGTVRAAIGPPPTCDPLRRWAAGARSTPRRWELDGVPIESVAFVSPPRPWSYGTWGHWMAPPLGRALDRLRTRWPFELVHAHSVVPPGYAAARWARAGGRRGALVISTHGPDIIHVAEAGPVARRATRSALTAADLIMANSTWARERCERIAGGPLPAAVVHLGADIPPPVRRRQRTTLVTVAHLVARKRHAVVLRALAELVPRLDLEYLVIGDGPSRPGLERLAFELGLEGRVTFLGQLDPSHALEELGACHVFVMPGAEEPFGVAFVEAMAAGLPAIGARGEGGPEDIAAAGEGMCLVAPDDPHDLAELLRALLADPERLDRLGRAARETVERHFTWRRCGEATVAAYRRALAGGVAAAP